MQYYVDLGPEQNPHINYEPSSLGGLEEGPRGGEEHRPYVHGPVTRETIERSGNVDLNIRRHLP